LRDIALARNAKTEKSKDLGERVPFCITLDYRFSVEDIELGRRLVVKKLGSKRVSSPLPAPRVSGGVPANLSG